MILKKKKEVRQCDETCLKAASYFIKIKSLMIRKKKKNKMKRTNPFDQF